MSLWDEQKLREVSMRKGFVFERSNNKIILTGKKKKGTDESYV